MALNNLASAATPFSRLYHRVENSAELSVVYQNILEELNRRLFWTDGSAGLRKILWMDGLKARKEDRATFGSSGIYLWGAKNRPLYIGITRGSFHKRFYRYIWSERSQCNLAHAYGDALSVRGIEGFPPEILEWYARGYGKSRARLQGAVRFAEEGIARVWFVLLPHNNRAEIEALEPRLISAAEDWNRKCGFRSLLNIEFKRGK